MKLLFVPLFALLLYSTRLQVQSNNLRTAFSWSRISFALNGHRHSRSPADGGFAFPTEEGGTNENDMGNQHNSQNSHNSQHQGVDIIPENNVPMGANRYKDKLFITIPRRRTGVPATLNFISIKKSPKENPPLIPYPSLGDNLIESTTQNGYPSLVSVYRTTVDSCNRLWMVDTGLLEYPGERRQVQPPAIVIIDLATDSIMHRYEIKPSVLGSNPGLASITPDVSSDKCDDAYAYIPDLSGFGLIVYSMGADDSWRVTHNYFYLNPFGGDLRVGGINFQWNDGIFSITLSGRNKDGYRTAYFHAMASFDEFSVSTRVLRNETLATRSYHGNDFKVLGSRGPRGQSSMHGLHQQSGIILAAMVNQDGVSCWNTGHPLKQDTVGTVHQDSDRMIYPSDLKIDQEGNVWVLSNTMPVFLYSQLDYEQPNFRVWTASVKDAVKGTVCAQRPRDKH